MDINPHTQETESIPNVKNAKKNPPKAHQVKLKMKYLEITRLNGKQQSTISIFSYLLYIC